MANPMGSTGGDPDRVRPPTLRAYLEAGCDLTLIPDLDQYARVIVISWVYPVPGADIFAASMRQTAEAWLRGEPASLVDGGEPWLGNFELTRQFLWLSEGIEDPEVADRFAEALPVELQQMCLDRIEELTGRSL